MKISGKENERNDKQKNGTGKKNHHQQYRLRVHRYHYPHLETSAGDEECIRLVFIESVVEFTSGITC